MHYFPAAQWTSIVKLPAFFQKFSNTIRSLRVKETNATSRNAVFVNLFALQKEEESKNEKEALFSDFP